MTQMEFAEILSRHLRARWPNWSPGEEEGEDWWRVMRYSTPEQAAEAIRRHATSSECIMSRPKIAAVRKLLPRARRDSASVDTTDYRLYIRCISAPDDHPEWEGCQWITCCPCPTAGMGSAGIESKQQAIHAYGEDLARSYQQANGGHWQAIVSAESLEADQLEGPEARREAEGRVLAGPVTPGQRHLVAIERTLSPEMSAVPAARTIAEMKDDWWDNLPEGW